MPSRCSNALGTHCSAPRFVVGLILIGCIVLAGVTFDPEKIESLLVWVRDNKRQGSILFLGLYILGVILMLPAMVMAMAAGAIFGLVYGSLLAWMGSSVGQVIAFVIGRYLLREVVLSYLTSTFPKWTAIDRALVTDGWKLITLLRLSPIAPWNVLNYALAVTSVPLGPYTVASSLSIIPYLMLFVYFGSLARNLADVFTGAAALDTRATILMGILSGVAIVGIVWYTTHFSRQAMNEALRQHADELPPEITGDAEVAELLGRSTTPRHLAEAGGAVVEMAPLTQPHLPEEEMLPSRAATSPLGRRSGAHSPSSVVTEAAARLAGMDQGRISASVGGTTLGGVSIGGLHSRSAHASPKAQSPRAARWQRSSEFL
jgi:uncharacterized membrane protein YdjX (TVP38/TMEM64 family)